MKQCLSCSQAFAYGLGIGLSSRDQALAVRRLNTVIPLSLSLCRFFLRPVFFFCHGLYHSFTFESVLGPSRPIRLVNSCATKHECCASCEGIILNCGPSCLSLVHWHVLTSPRHSYATLPPFRPARLIQSRFFEEMHLVSCQGDFLHLCWRRTCVGLLWRAGLLGTGFLLPHMAERVLRRFILLCIIPPGS